ncbi:MAG: ATP-binding protein [Nitrospinae bacterium]|nr:ATP-binding protein [Nitrospinota bacterium]
MDDETTNFEQIFSSFVDGVLLVSPEGIIKRANPAVEEMFHSSLESLTNQPWTEFFPEQPEMDVKIRHTLTHGTSFRDLRCQGFRKARRSSFPVSVTVSPYMNMNKGGPPEGVVLHVRDMSLFKELEESSKRMDELSHLGVLSLGMAHEIKNPLVAISGSAQLLRKRLPDQHHKFLDVVIKESDRINRMLERMLTFARPTRLDLKLLNIHQILEEILLLEKKNGHKNVRFVQNYDPSLPQVEGDEDQLKQVFLNLVRNALEAMPDGGTLELRTRIHSHYTIKTEANPNSRQAILVEIRDTGIGIEEVDLNHMFTPFHTTKSKGNGLGLPLSLKIVENHQGKIKVQSKTGQGTQFQVFLPVEQG